MPNGRSGGFVIEKVDLKHLVKSLHGGPAAAKIFSHSSQTRLADTQELSRLVDECRTDRIAVEEQDHKFYIIHLSNEPELLWVMVGSEMPLFLELRQCHDRWAAEHPNWKGWIAF